MTRAMALLESGVVNLLVGYRTDPRRKVARTGRVGVHRMNRQLVQRFTMQPTNRCIVITAVKGASNTCFRQPLRTWPRFLLCNRSDDGVGAVHIRYQPVLDFSGVSIFILHVIAYSKFFAHVSIALRRHPILQLESMRQEGITYSHPHRFKARFDCTEKRLGDFVLGPGLTTEWGERDVSLCTFRGVLARSGRRQRQDEGRSATGIVLGNNAAAVRFHDPFANTEAQALSTCLLGPRTIDPEERFE